MLLTFVWPVTNGLVEASERLETSAQAVLRQQHERGLQACSPQPQQPLQQWWQRLPSLLPRLRSLLAQQQQWLRPLWQLLLVQPGLRAAWRVLARDARAALSSKQGAGAVCWRRALHGPQLR